LIAVEKRPFNPFASASTGLPRRAGAAALTLLAALGGFGLGPQVQAGPALATGKDFVAQAREVMQSAASKLEIPGARIEVEVGELDSRLHLAPCAQVQAYLPANARAWGRTRVGLRCTQGEKLWNVSVPVVVRVLAAAPTLKSALPAGTVLKPEHLDAALVDWALQLETPVQAAPALVDRVLAHALPAGSAIRPADLRARLWFAAGDTVRVEAKGEGFSVSTTAQALGPGAEGQRVRVRTEAGQVLTGLAVGAHRVEVAL
jgi:flagellar basal body P-ring formation protein FlgA